MFNSFLNLFNCLTLPVKKLKKNLWLSRVFYVLKVKASELKSSKKVNNQLKVIATLSSKNTSIEMLLKLAIYITIFMLEPVVLMLVMF